MSTNWWTCIGPLTTLPFLGRIQGSNYLAFPLWRAWKKQQRSPERYRYNMSSQPLTFVTCMLIHNEWNRKDPLNYSFYTEHSRGDLLCTAEMEMETDQRIQFRQQNIWFLAEYCYSPPFFGQWHTCDWMVVGEYQCLHCEALWKLFWCHIYFPHVCIFHLIFT